MAMGIENLGSGIGLRATDTLGHGGAQGEAWDDMAGLRRSVRRRRMQNARRNFFRARARREADDCDGGSLGQENGGWVRSLRQSALGAMEAQVEDLERCVHMWWQEEMQD